ncbi:uncharacterized protein [Oscarella lobularis]|uniref:uncharacterized protein isoform X2 n=1 Tax=Oscarella lobularis TaxID=121494 RepID=UPI0033143F89
MKRVFLVIALAAISHCQLRSPYQSRKCCRVQSQYKKFGPGIRGNPVAVDVGSCTGSCTGVSTATIIDGTIDYFVGPEPASPSPDFVNSLILDGRTLVGFDEFPVDRWFAHTVRLPPNCRDLVRMRVKICLNASSNSLTTTDSVFFYHPINGNILYSRSLPTLFGSWPPRSSGCRTIGFGSSDEVFQYAATNGVYHIAVQDDTGVDYIQTTLWYASPKKCLPSLWTHADVPLATGTEKVDKIIGCECQNQEVSRCLRQPKKVVFFQNSIFETAIDVGYCGGSCRQVPYVPLAADDARDVTISGRSATASRKAQVAEESIHIFPYPQKQLICQPVLIDRVDIKGPYGSECVEIVKQCECKPQCYRMPYFKHFVEVFKDENGLLSEQRRKFNVGKCVGTCNQAAYSGVTNLGDKDCSVKCSPRGYKYTSRFLTRDGSYVSVPLITACDCKKI